MTDINHGVILGQRPEDWMAGSLSGIVYEVRNESGDWRPYLPTKEIQYGKEDSMSCVPFSLVSAIEIQEIFLTGKETNYSDRWTAKRSGTTNQGNYLWKVADTVRKEGIVLETSYPTPPNYTFAEFHANIPADKQAELEKEGQQWLSKWQFQYEFIPLNLKAMLDHIKQAPLQIVIPGHAIVNFLCEDDIIHYFDTYVPHEKQTSFTNLQAVLKPLLTLRKPMSNAIFLHRKGTDEYGFFLPATSEDALKDKALNLGRGDIIQDDKINFSLAKEADFQEA